MKGLSPHSGSSQTIFFCCISVIFLLSVPLAAEDPTKRLSWHVGYAVASPLGMKQRVPSLENLYLLVHLENLFLLKIFFSLPLAAFTSVL